MRSFDRTSSVWPFVSSSGEASREWLFYIVATRNRLIHGYLGIDDDTVCSIVQDDLRNC